MKLHVERNPSITMRHYYFHPRFSAAILSGRKTLTVRRVWENPVRRGDLLCLHIDVPRPDKKTVLKAFCSDAYLISVSSEAVIVGRRKLSASEIRAFLRKDGFRSVADMRTFFEQRYSLPFSGQCICWEFAQKPAATNDLAEKAQHLLSPYGQGAK